MTIINGCKVFFTLATMSAMIVLFVLTLGDVASGPDVPRPVMSSAHSFDLSSSLTDPGHRAQVIGAGLDHLEVAR